MSCCTDAYRQILESLLDALESRDAETNAHSRRVSAYATKLTLELDPGLLDDPTLEWGFLLHDIGMIGIPDAVLLKPGPLDSAERRCIEKHPLIGHRLVGHIPFVQGRGIEVIRSHHERWDGLGYPDGLKGDRIPPAARIFSVADALDAMTDRAPVPRGDALGRRGRRDRASARDAVRPGRRRSPDRGGAGDQGEPREQPARRRLERSLAHPVADPRPMARRQAATADARCVGMWTFHSAHRAKPTQQSSAEEATSRLRHLAQRELDLVSRLSVLYERRELYPHEVTDRQVAELDQKLDEIRAEIELLRARH